MGWQAEGLAMSSWKNALLIVCAVLVATSALPAQAQDKPAGAHRRSPVIILPYVIGEPTGRPVPDPNAKPKVCFWRDTTGGTAFGKSGFCPASISSAVGASCRCSSNSVGRPDGKYVGTVMFAPQGDGSTQVVR